LNLNRLFPRLSIRAKLAIAFTGMAIIPVSLVAAPGVWHTLRQAQDFAVATVRHDVAEAGAQTEQLLRGVETDLSYVADDLLGSRLRRGWASGDQGEIQGAARLLRRKPLHVQMKAIGETGTLLALVDSTGQRDIRGREDEGAFYGVRSRTLEEGQHLILPLEVRDGTDPGRTRPVLAVILPVLDDRGVYKGAVVTEVNAAELFAPLENASPNLGGVTGLMDVEGFLLYHSERKADWAELLADRTALDLGGEFEGILTDSILDRVSPITVALSGDRIAASVSLNLHDAASAPLVVYRILPVATLQRAARQFLRVTLLAGIALMALVAFLAALAAHQITQPIYQLRRAARDLAAGGELDAELRIETSDEIEDLAEDFNVMAGALKERRRGLETLVEDRTRALGETSAELTGILQHSADAIVGLDPTGRVRLWNDGARDLFGYETQEVLDQPIDDLILPDEEGVSGESDFIAIETLERGALMNFQTRRVAKDGTLIPVSLTHTAIRDEDGGLFGFSLIIRDTTLQTRLERQIRRSERLAALSVMAGGLAHELGNPLAVIENRIECMQQEMQDQEGMERLEADLDVLSQHANRLHGLIGDFLSFARDGDGERTTMSLREVVVRASRLLDRTFRARHVKLEIEIDGSTLEMSGNEHAIETTLINLLINALDATSAGETVTLHVATASESDEIVVVVSDSGYGIPVEIQHQIFEPFFTTKAAERGTGLGLAVCASVVQRHGGRIDVQSVPGSGATFTLRFPLS